MKSKRKIFLSFLISLCLLVSFLSLHPQNCESAAPEKGRYTAAEVADQTDSKSVEAEAPIPQPSPNSLTETMQGSGHSSSVSNDSGSLYFTQHLMCKDYTSDGKTYYPVDPTTTFRPSDTKAVCLATVFINRTIEFRWFYRDNSSKNWVSCWNYTRLEISPGEYSEESYLLIAGQWLYCPRAYKVDVYLDYYFSFSEFFEITNAGLNSPRVCENIENGNPVDMKSRFTIGPVDTKACYYLKFDNMAYFNDETGSSHNFTTAWIQPDGTTYKTYTYAFGDYKDNDTSLNCWENGVIPDDFIFINSSTPVGNWKVEVFMDSYYSNGIWTQYGPLAVTPFVVGNTSVADWTFMVYLDGDNTLENASIDVFLKMANVTASQNVNMVVQLDRAPGDERYGNWTDCKRFNITKGMTPEPQNAVQDIGEVDMGDPSTLKDFLNWTINNYPANSFFLSLWDHGSGCMGVCYDMTNGNDTLLLPKLSEAMTGLPVIIDDVLIDACSMTMAEVAYQIKDFANILIGPEGLGYAPAPYENYLTDLTSNPSMSPTAFAKEIVNDYIGWCWQVPNYYIPSATMSAIDLTKVTTFTEAIDEFASTLKEKETLQYNALHGQISLARNLTTEYEGPYAGQFGYFYDLYNFSQQIQSQIPDQELRNVSNQVTTALSIGNAVITESDKNYPDSHGLAIFFPENKANYTSFEGLYEMTAFAKDTLWDEFVKYHISGCLLTVKTSYPHISVKIAKDTYNTDDEGKIQVYLPLGSYTISVPSIVPTAPDSQGVFTQWTDNSTSNPKILSLDGALTTEAQYETQYLMVVRTNFGTTDPLPGPHWCKANSPVNITAAPPNTASGERYVWIGWTQMDAGTSNETDNPSYIPMDRPVNVTAAWRHEYSLAVTSSYGMPTPPSGWFEAGTNITEWIISPFSGPSGTRYVCTGWNGTGDIPSMGNATVTNFSLNASSSIQWNWKTQYLLTMRTDPAELYPQPNATPEGPWYDDLTTIKCTAQQISGYDFQYWSSAGTNWPTGNNTITTMMDAPYELTAHYVPSQPWWGILARADVISAIFGLLGTVVTVGLVGGTWFRSRKRRDIVKAFLAEIDDIYSRLKTDPKKCEEELHTLRNIILEGLTKGKINEDNYEVLDGRIDKYASELAKKQRGKHRSSDNRSEE